MADEPTSDLDREPAEFMAALFMDFHAAGKTGVVASHDPAVLALATDACRLRCGRLEA